MGTTRDAAGQLATKATTLNINNSPKSWKKVYAHNIGENLFLRPPLPWTHFFGRAIGRAVVGPVRHKPCRALFGAAEMPAEPQRWWE